MKVAHHSFLEEVSDDQVSPEGGYSTPDILCRQSRPKHPPPYQSFNFNFGQPPPGVDRARSVGRVPIVVEKDRA